MKVIEMKKTYILGLMAAVLGFTACNSEDDATLPESKQQGMVLKATVSQAIETRATIDDATDTWVFDFSQGDNIAVNNDEIGAYNSYSFTKGATNFTSLGAEPSATPVNWYAYFPGIQVLFTNQTGRKEDVANNYALFGATTEPTTGEDGLSINMQPKVAILVIDNQAGSLDINVKNGPNSWIVGLNAVGTLGDFTIWSSNQKESLLSTTAPGLHYIAVPAGVQLSIKDGDRVIKSTGANGLTAGKYYNLTIYPLGVGYATANINGVETPVKWIQLWKNGPKWAEYNVGDECEMSNWGLKKFSWGCSIPLDYEHFNTGTEVLSGDNDTATKLWGSTWRMPTSQEFDNLLSNCDGEWTSNYKGSGLDGYTFTGRGDYSQLCIFLLENAPNIEYWSSTPSLYGSYALYIDSESKKVEAGVLRSERKFVRAVLNEQP